MSQHSVQPLISLQHAVPCGTCGSWPLSSRPGDPTSPDDRVGGKKDQQTTWSNTAIENVFFCSKQDFPTLSPSPFFRIQPASVESPQVEKMSKKQLSECLLGFRLVLFQVFHAFYRPLFQILGTRWHPIGLALAAMLMAYQKTSPICRRENWRTLKIHEPTSWPMTVQSMRRQNSAYCCMQTKQQLRMCALEWAQCRCHMASALRMMKLPFHSKSQAKAFPFL